MRYVMDKVYEILDKQHCPIEVLESMDFTLFSFICLISLHKFWKKETATRELSLRCNQMHGVSFKSLGGESLSREMQQNRCREK